MRGLFVLFLFLLLTGPTAAQQAARQSGEYVVKHWTTAEGLPINYITNVTQSSDGYMWIGTSAGLLRYDGITFKNYDVSHFPGWLEVWVVEIFETPDSLLWMSSEGLVARIKEGQVLEDDLKLWSYVYSMKLESGELFIASDTGVYVYDHITKTLKREAFEEAPPRYVTAVSRFPDGTLFLASQSGMTFKVKDDSLFKPLPGLEQENVRTMHTFNSDTLWVTTVDKFGFWTGGVFTALVELGVEVESQERAFHRTQDGNILIMEPHRISLYAGNEFVTLAESPGDVEQGYFRWSKQQSDGTLWIGYNSGVEGKLLRFSNNKLEEIVLGEDIKLAYDMFEDRESNLWFATTNGLVMLAPRKFQIFSRTEGLPENQVFSVEADSEGSVWAGTWGKGLAKINDEGISAYSLVALGSSDFVRASFIDPDGKTMWFGTENGVLQIHEEKGASHILSWADPYNARWVMSIARSPSGEYFAATNRDLHKIVDSRLELVDIPNIPKDANPRHVFFDKKGRLWLSTKRGLLIQENGTWRYFSMANGFPQDKLISVYEDDRGRVIVGSEEGGLIVFEDNAYQTITQLDGLSQNSVKSIIQDNNSDYWITHDKGLSRVRHAEFNSFLAGQTDRINPRLFTESDGLLSAEFTTGSPSITKDNNGWLWFATLKGVARIDPDAIPSNTHPPNIQVTHLEVDGEEVPVKPDFEFTHDHNNISFHYAALSFTAPGQNIYKYRLKGQERDWQGVTSDTEVRYTNLDPGRYEFEVLGANNDGVWSSEPARISFKIMPPFYGTWWFRSCVLLLFTGLAGWMTYRTRQQQKLRVELVRNEERSRISRDLHEGIKTRVNSVNLFLGYLKDDNRLSLDEKKQLESKIQTATNLLNDLNDTVWVLDSKKDTLSSLIYRIVDITSKEIHGVRLKLDYPDEIPDLHIEGMQRRHIIYLYREALSNALKHADASLIVLSIQLEAPHLQIELKDNGKGFDQTQKSEGHGLENMHKRVAEIGGDLNIETDSREGTSVQIRLKI